MCPTCQFNASLPKYRKDYWDKVIQRIHKKVYEDDGNGGKRRVPNDHLYIMFEKVYGDMLDKVGAKHMARKINESSRGF